MDIVLLHFICAHVCTSVVYQVRYIFTVVPFMWKCSYSANVQNRKKAAAKYISWFTNLFN